MKRDDIDFHAVRAEHSAIHGRLLNWARCQRYSGGGSNCLPMFRFYRDGYHEPPVAREPPDHADGTQMQRAFASLPEKHRHAIGWAYVRTYIPLRFVCKDLGVNRASLLDLIHDGRTMLKNRSATLNPPQARTSYI